MAVLKAKASLRTPKRSWVLPVGDQEEEPGDKPYRWVILAKVAKNRPFTWVFGLFLPPMTKIANPYCVCHPQESSGKTVLSAPLEKTFHHK